MNCPHCHREIFFEQGNLFESGTSENGDSGRDRGMSRVHEAADEEWKNEALLAIWTAASQQQSITVDSAHLVIRPDVTTRDERAWGPMMVKARKEGWIEPTENFVKSERPSCHSTPRRVWMSLIYSPFMIR